MVESCETSASETLPSTSFKHKQAKELKFTFSDNGKASIVFKRKDKIKHITNAAVLMREASSTITRLGNTFAGGLTTEETAISQHLILLSATLDRLKNAI